MYEIHTKLYNFILTINLRYDGLSGLLVYDPQVITGKVELHLTTRFVGIVILVVMILLVLLYYRLELSVSVRIVRRLYTCVSCPWHSLQRSPA